MRPRAYALDLAVSFPLLFLAIRKPPSLAHNVLSQSSYLTSSVPRLPAFLATALCLSAAQAAGLNDTDQTQSYGAANAPVACSAAVGGDAGVLPRQDARYGRDPHAAIPSGLSKIGAGDAGFDFSKIANSGTTLATSVGLGSTATEWACTKDNVTGLVWEVKTTSGLRNSAHIYTWYSNDGTKNGGNAGALGTNSCGGSLAAAPYKANATRKSLLPPSTQQRYAVPLTGGYPCGVNCSRSSMPVARHHRLTAPNSQTRCQPSTGQHQPTQATRPARGSSTSTVALLVPSISISPTTSTSSCGSCVADSDLALL